MIKKSITLFIIIDLLIVSIYLAFTLFGKEDVNKMKDMFTSREPVSQTSSNGKQERCTYYKHTVLCIEQ